MRIILDIPIRLSDAIAVMGTVANNYSMDKTVFAVATDSRECEDGDLFFSLAASPKKRIEHSIDAMSRGALPICDAPGFITVESTEHALLSFAAFYKSRLPRLLYTVGITGSVGKSTTKRYVSGILSESFRVSSTIGNFNNRIGISLSILSSPRNTEVLVLEMGMNHRGEIKEMAEAVCPDVCVITNIGTAHIGNLGSREAIRDAKCEIITNAARFVLFPSSESLLSGIRQGVSISHTSNADIMLEKRADGYLLKYAKRKIEGIHPLINGEHNLNNFLSALSVGICIGLSDDEIRDAANSLSDVFSSARIHKICDLTIIDDTYNSSPEASFAMIDHLTCYPAPHYAVFSDMLELGDFSARLHYKLGQMAATLDGLYLIGEYRNCTANGAIDAGMSHKKIRFVKNWDADNLANIIRSEIKEGTVLIKGSHATRLFEVVKKLCAEGE